MGREWGERYPPIGQVRWGGATRREVAFLHGPR
jgi:hypothetical protein